MISAHQIKITGNKNVSIVHVIQLINCALLSPKKLTVRDEQPTKLCGRTSPGLIVTNSNMVKLEYHIDDEGQSNGWSLDYSTHSEDDQ